jgi:hypothetical protein
MVPEQTRHALVIFGINNTAEGFCPNEGTEAE